MTIGKKIIWGFLAVGAFLSVGAFLAIFSIESGMKPLGQLHVPALNQIQFIESTLKGAVQESFAYLVSGEVIEKKEFLEWAKGFDQEAEKFIEITRLHESGKEKEATLFNEFGRQQKLLVEQAIVLFKEYEVNGSISKVSFLAYEHMVDSLISKVEAVVKYEKLASKEAQQLVFSLLFQVEWSLYILAILGIAGSAAMGFMIARNIAKRINILKTAAVAIEGGSFETRVHLGEYDELGILGSAVNQMAEGLQNKFLKEKEFATVVEANHRMKQEINERHRAEQALKESNDKYQDLYDNSPDFCASVDQRTGKIVQCNQTLVSAIGYMKEEIVGKPILEMYHPDSLDGARQAFEVFVKTGKVHDAELQLKKKDGSKIDVELNVSSVRDAQGNILKSRSVWRDITDRRVAQRTLKSRELQQATVAEIGQDALPGMDLQHLMEKMVGSLTTTLNVEYSKILELLPEGKDFHLRAGVGWKPGLVGSSKSISGERNSQAGFTLLSHEPVVVEDLQAETRFNGPPLLHDHGVVSGISVIIHGKNRPYGVLGVHSNHKRHFSVEDINFLKAIAYILAEAIERKQVEGALRESEETTRQVLEAIVDMVIVKGPGSRILWANKAFRDYYGMTNTQLQELIDAPFNDPSHTAQYLEDDARVFDTGETQYITQEPVTCYDGEVRLFNTVKSPVVNEEGQVTKLVAVARDITENLAVVEALRQNESRLAHLLHASPVVIYTCIPHEPFAATYISPNITWQLGYKPEDFLTNEHFWATHIHPEDQQRIFAAFSRLFETAELIHEYRFLHNDGTYRWMRDQVNIVRDSEGHPLELVGYWIDITERKEAEEVIRSNEQRYKTLVEHSPYSIHQINLEGCFLSVNTAGLQMIGLKEEQEVIGKPFLQLVEKEDQARLEELFNLALHGETSSFEFKNIQGHYLQSSFVPIKNSSGKVEKVMGLTQDITQRRHAEEAFQNLVKGTAAETGEAFFEKFIQHLALSVKVRFALITEFTGEDHSKLRALAGWHLDSMINDFEYDVKNTPCEISLRNGSVYFPDHVRELFPLDKTLIEVDADSYFGLALVGKSGQTIGNLCVVNDSPLENFEEAKSILSIFAARAAVELERMRAEEEVNKALIQTREISRKLVAAEESERKRISRELHDEFGQTLAGLKFDLTKLGKQLLPEILPQHRVGYGNQFHLLANTVDSAIHSMRRIATDLRPSLLDNLGLVAAMEWLSQDFQKRTSIPCALIVSPGVNALAIDPERSLTLFRIIQELFTNVLKHARASNVVVTLTLEDGTLALEFTDDGRGVTKEELDHTKSLGLIGIKERLAVFNGQFTIQGEPEKGTRVGIQIPLTSAPTPVAGGGK